MFSNDENSNGNNLNSRTQNARPKMPNIGDLGDPIRLLGSIFSNKSNVKSCCENCSVKFGLIKSKKICGSCKFEFCSNCFRLETDLGATLARSTICHKCRIFNNRPIKREDLIKLKVKELKWYLRSHRIPSNLCKEKSDLVDLILQNFGIRTQQQTNQAGPSSRRSFDDIGTTVRNNASTNSSASTSRNTSHNTSPLRSATSSNLNSDNNSNESSQLGSEWEFINQQSNSIHNSNNNLNRNVDNNSSSNNQTRADVTIESNSDFVNLAESNVTETDVNSNNVDYTGQAINDVNRTNNNTRLSNSASSQTRLSNSNVNNLKKPNNLSESTESLSNFKNFNIADVSSEDEIRSLSVRQLKLVLTRNYVNYKGVVEKEELLEKAIRLWNQIKQDTEMFDDTKDEDLCKICMENPINCCLLDCGHLVACLDCGKRLTECPVCRQYVVRALRTFKS